MNKGTTQGSVSGPHLFNLFINVLVIRDCDLTSIVKYADETTLLVKVNENEVDFSQEVVNQFFSGTQDSAVACNPKKCNELILCKKVAHDIYPVNNIMQVSRLKVVGLPYKVITDLMSILWLICSRPISVFR